MCNQWNENWLSDVCEVGLNLLGKACLTGATIGALLFGGYAARADEGAVLDGELSGRQYALDILAHGARGALILGGLGVLRALQRSIEGGQSGRSER